MKVSLGVEKVISNELAEAIFNDPKVTRNGHFDGFSTATIYADMMIRTMVSGYCHGEAPKKCSIKNPTSRLLTRVIEGTWLAQREDQPGVPNVAIVTHGREDRGIVVSYFTEEESTDWISAMHDLDSLREKLRPPSVRPPGGDFGVTPN